MLNEWKQWKCGCRVLADKRHGTWVCFLAGPLGKVHTQAVDPTFGIDVVRLLKQEGNLLSPAKIVDFGRPCHLHLVLGMKRPAHPASGNPSNPAQVDVGDTFHQRLDAEESQSARDGPQGI